MPSCFSRGPWSCRLQPAGAVCDCVAAGSRARPAVGPQVDRLREDRPLDGGDDLVDHRRGLLDLAHDAREFVEGLVAGLDEERDPLRVPVEGREARPEHALEHGELAHEELALDGREAGEERVVLAQLELQVLAVAVVLVLLERHVEGGVGDREAHAVQVL